ncbi:MAG: Ferric iron transporter, ATP-binding protein [Ilumatobacteraceae bacterium]|nr:Ferric iron transporter, ATP-binding protein [Ilumatobacteraceae bacterium]
MADIRVAGLTAGYGTELVLHDVDLVVPSGSLTCVLGPSGCGKTTLLRVIAGFTQARSGTVAIDGQVVDDGHRQLAPERRRVGYVPQEGALFPHLDVAGNVGFALARNSREQRQARAETVAEMLDLVGMAEMGERLPHQLSGGQQQRVAVARALASRPSVVLLDEPFASLDASLRARLREDIRAVLRRTEVTAILVTHDRAEALSVADQIAVIELGRIRQAGSPVELYTRPADRHVATFVGDANIVAGTVHDGVAASPLGNVAVDPGCTIADGPVTLVLRPERIQIVPAGAAGSTVEGDVVRVEYFGHDARVDVQLRGDNGLRIAVRLPGVVPPAEGDVVGLTMVGPIWALPSEP